MAAAAAQHRIFFCAVDQPEHSTFSHPAIARSGPVVVAVSTSGTAPTLSRRLREELERVFGEANLAAFANALGELREKTPSEKRRTVLGSAVSGLHLTGTLEIPTGHAEPSGAPLAHADPSEADKP
jgi:siroheme synthase-like protein